MDCMSKEDAEKFKEITEKYGLTKIAEEYPEWLIEKLRDNLWYYCSKMVENITDAYSIWATNKAEAEERRILQDRAISSCENILKELELALELLPVNVDKYMPYVECLDKEIAYLKTWRKNDNKKNRTLK